MDIPLARNGGGRRDNRSKILMVTCALLRTRGLAALTIDDVAREAGVARRTVYNHFASTADLFVTSRKLLIDELGALVPLSIARTQSSEIALREFAAAVLRMLADERHLDLYFSLLRDGDNHPSLMLAYERVLHTPIRAQFSEFFAIRTWPALRDPERAAHEVMAALVGIAIATRNIGTTSGWSDAGLSALLSGLLAAHRPTLSKAA